MIGTSKFIHIFAVVKADCRHWQFVSTNTLRIKKETLSSFRDSDKKQRLWQQTIIASIAGTNSMMSASLHQPHAPVTPTAATKVVTSCMRAEKKAPISASTADISSTPSCRWWAALAHATPRK